MAKTNSGNGSGTQERKEKKWMHYHPHKRPVEEVMNTHKPTHNEKKKARRELAEQTQGCRDTQEM